MPNQIKDFLLKAQKKDAKSVTIVKLNNKTKFKVQYRKYLCTLCVDDRTKAKKLQNSLPPGLPVNVIQ